MTAEQLQLEQDAAYYVYLLARPDGSVFYVGKGTKDRIDDHERQARKGCRCDKCRLIQRIWDVGGQVVKSIVYRTGDSRDALRHEAELIHKYRKQLVNKKHGRRHNAIMISLIEDAPITLRIPGKRRSRKEEEREQLRKYYQREAGMNVLASRRHGAIRRHKDELVERLEAEMEALEILMNPGIVGQLRLEGF